MANTLTPGMGSQAQPFRPPQEPHRHAAALRKFRDEAVPWFGGATARELMVYLTHAHRGANMMKCHEATDKLFLSTKEIKAHRRNLENQVNSNEITREEGICGQEECDMSEKYSTRHFLEEVAHYNMPEKQAREILTDAKVLEPDQVLEVSGHNTLFFHNRDMKILQKTSSKNKNEGVGVEGSNPSSFASISANRNNTQQSSSPARVIHSVPYGSQLNFFSIALLGSGLSFLVWKAFVNNNSPSLKNHHFDSSSFKNNHFDSNITKPFIPGMESTPQLQDGIEILEKFNNQKLTYKQSKILLMRSGLFDILQIEDLLGEIQIKKDQEHIPGKN